MPQSTTALPTGPEQPKAGQVRVEIPTTEPEAQPTRRRRPRASERDQAGDDMLAHVHVDERAPKMEPWLWVLFASVATAALALVVPRSARLALHVATGALVLVGFVMLFVQERRNAARHRQSATPDRRAA